MVLVVDLLTAAKHQPLHATQWNVASECDTMERGETGASIGERWIRRGLGLVVRFEADSKRTSKAS